MSSLAERNSAAAAELAKKKKERLARANQIKAERDAQSKGGFQSSSSSMGGMIGAPQDRGGLGAEYAALEMRSDSKMTPYRRPSGSSKQSGSAMPQLPRNVETSTFSVMTIPASEIAKYSTPANQRQRPSMEAPKGLMQHVENTGPVVASADVYSTASLAYPRTLHSHLSNSASYFRPPVDPAGRLVDVSNIPSLCMSTNHTSEVIVGSSDHALYSIDITNPSKRPVTMHSKTCGHSDWVTGVCHLQDGRVLSCSMDSKLCLWDAARRRCDNLEAHMGSISKVL
jgi:WD40 repeat protein